MPSQQIVDYAVELPSGGKLHLQTADERQDSGLLVEAPAGEPHVELSWS